MSPTNVINQSMPSTNVANQGHQPIDAIRRYNRILDLERFRMMTADGRIPAENFVTVTSAGNDFSLLGKMKTEDDVVKYFKEYSHSQASTKLQRLILLYFVRSILAKQYVRCVRGTWYCATPYVGGVAFDALWPELGDMPGKPVYYIFYCSSLLVLSPIQAAYTNEVWKQPLIF